MILEGQGRLVRNYPHVPGIDFAGTVLQSRSPEFKAGDPVLLTGWRVGEVPWGGYVERARVKGAYVVGRPGGAGGGGAGGAGGGLAGAAGAKGKIGGPPPGAAAGAAGDGDRHCRLHRDAGG